MRCVLLVIDVQKAVFEMKQPVFAGNQLIKNINFALNAARNNSTKIVFSLHENKSFLKKGSKGYEIVDEIDVCDSDIFVVKEKPDLFSNTGFDDKLKEESIDTVIVTGLISNGCVKDTCVSALAKRYIVYLISDAHSTIYKNAEMIISNINHEMEAAGAKLLSHDELPSLLRSKLI